VLDAAIHAQSPDIRYEGIHCDIGIHCFHHYNVVLLRIRGTDVGEFGDGPMQALGKVLAGSARVHLFIDARDVKGASIGVSGEWAKWLSAHRDSFTGITMLTGSRFIQITAEFVRRFASLEGHMRICTEPAVFDHTLAQALRFS